jgi:hypothetical protein
MSTSLASSVPATDKRLTPQNLLQDFGAPAAVTRQGVRILHEALGVEGREAMERWMGYFGKWAGRALDKLPKHLARLAVRYGVSNSSEDASQLLFAMQTYYALLVKLLAERFGPGGVVDAIPDCPFSWCGSARSEAVSDLMGRLKDAMACYRIEAASSESDDCDLFKPLYQNLFPRPLRRQLGEYYTPDWLANHVLDQVGYSGEPGMRLLDPACGSGTFLLLALRRWRRRERGEGRGERGEEKGNVPFTIVGFDINPLAVMTARANYLIAVADLLPKTGRVEIPVYLCDSIRGNTVSSGADIPVCRGKRVFGRQECLPRRDDLCGENPFDFVVGNPPWIAWDNLPDEERAATKPLWERYGLFSLSGKDARHGGGKKDLSMLMLYATADWYLKRGGRLGMVITQTLFQTVAGDGFRRFRLGPEGDPLKVLRVDDFVEMRPFDDASNWTSTIVLQKGEATEYPVPYYKWREKGEGRREKGEGRGVKGEGREKSRAGHFSAQWSECNVVNPTPELPHQRNSKIILSLSPLPSPQLFFASPVDPSKPTSPWIVQESSNSPSYSLALSSDYSAHLGANSGGANGVYWVEVLGPTSDGMRIRNITAKGKRRVETVECMIEPDLLYPLLRWGDVRRYSAMPRGCILLAQDPDTRTGIPESVMRERFPRTLAYLEQFRALLESRAAYRRYQAGGPFYSMYNVGPYTAAPVKVVWRRMDRQINAAVAEPWAHPLLGSRFMIPQETCVLVACDSTDEAHYLCAVLNSAVVNQRVLAHSVRGGKGFGTPGMLDFLPIRRFQPDDRRHLELASLSRQAHVAAASLREGIQTMIEENQRRIDSLAGELLG